MVRTQPIVSKAFTATYQQLMQLIKILMEGSCLLHSYSIRDVHKLVAYVEIHDQHGIKGYGTVFRPRTKIIAHAPYITMHVTDHELILIKTSNFKISSHCTSLIIIVQDFNTFTSLMSVMIAAELY